MKLNLSSADQIREFAWMRYIEPARHNGETTIRIKSGDIVNGLGLKNKTPNVCTALRSKIFQELYGVELIGEQGPPSGMSTTVVFTYRNTGSSQAASGHEAHAAFAGLRGIAKKSFQQFGGGEKFLRAEREGFYGNEAHAQSATKSAGRKG